jgi:hypothetical protein
MRCLAPLADLVNNEQVAARDVASDDDDTSPWTLADGRFELRTPAACEVGEELTVFYGHEAGAELVISYGFLPLPNSCEVVPLYCDLEELLDDDRFSAPEPARVTRAKAALLRSSAAAAAPLAVRPGGVAGAGHLLGCLRVLHAEPEDVAALVEAYDAAVGHDTWQWPPTCDAPAAERRARADGKVRSHAAARAREVLDGMATSVSTDEALLAAAVGILLLCHVIARGAASRGQLNRP